ncbi:unnamed protein product [Symbiodinium sp. CCMP2592]|nr:unnamed protein product [Symbiodinium sp. CCMP2592]
MADLALKALQICLERLEPLPTNIPGFLLAERSWQNLACCCKEFSVSRKARKEQACNLLTLVHKTSWWKMPAAAYGDCFTNLKFDILNLRRANFWTIMTADHANALLEWEIDVATTMFKVLTDNINTRIGPYYALSFAHRFIERMHRYEDLGIMGIPRQIMKKVMRDTLPAPAEWMTYLSHWTDTRLRLYRKWHAPEMSNRLAVARLRVHPSGLESVDFEYGSEAEYEGEDEEN